MKRWIGLLLAFGVASVSTVHAQGIVDARSSIAPASALAVDDTYAWFGDGFRTVLWRRDPTGVKDQFQIAGLAIKTQVFGNNLYYASKHPGPTEAGGPALPYLGCITRSGKRCRMIPFSPTLQEVDDFAIFSASSRAGLDSRAGYIVVDQLGANHTALKIREPGVFRVVSARNGDFWFASTSQGRPDRLVRVDSRGFATTLGVGRAAIVDMAACGADAIAVALSTPQGLSQIETVGSAISRRSPLLRSPIFTLRSDGNDVIAIAGPTAQDLLLLRRQRGFIKIASSKAGPYRDAAVHRNVAWMLTSDGGLTHAALRAGPGFCG